MKVTTVHSYNDISKLVGARYTGIIKVYNPISSAIERVTLKEGRSHSYNDEPSIIYKDGAKIWHKNGKYHRGNGKPAIEYPDGKQCYFINGKPVPKEVAETYDDFFPEED